MDRAAASAHRISYVTENPLRRLRPAAEIRAGLAARDPNLQRTGMSVWLARRDCRGTFGATLCPTLAHWSSALTPSVAPVDHLLSVAELQAALAIATARVWQGRPCHGLRFSTTPFPA